MSAPKTEPKIEWADEKPSSSDESNEDEVEEKKEETKHDTEDTHSRGRRGDRRRGRGRGRGGYRNKYNENQRPRTLHPSHYTDVISKANAPYELKIIIDKDFKSEDIAKHFTTADKIEIKELPMSRTPEGMKKYMLTIQNKNDALKVVQSYFESHVINSVDYKLFYDPPADYINDTTTRPKGAKEYTNDYHDTKYQPRERGKRDDGIVIQRNEQKKIGLDQKEGAKEETKTEGKVEAKEEAKKEEAKKVEQTEEKKEIKYYDRKVQDEDNRMFDDYPRSSRRRRGRGGRRGGYDRRPREDRQSENQEDFYLKHQERLKEQKVLPSPATGREREDEKPIRRLRIIYAKQCIFGFLMMHVQVW